MEIVRKEEDGDDEEEEELKTILFYQFEYIPNQTPKVYFGAKENGEQMDLDQVQCQNEAWDGEVELEFIFNPMETLFLCKKLTKHRSFPSIHSSIWLVCCPYCSSKLVGIFLHILDLLS
ncbi:hypothetical protein NC652_004404 [Populus alba x Populus x berolinensis]|nr:hypothetical protein NC652_004404 [Populus alba x Populus x berolinensis]